MKVKITKELMQKMDDINTSLTNTEIAALHLYYTTVITSLHPCPPEFKLVLTECRRKVDRLQGWMDARGERHRRSEQYSSPHKERATGETVDCCV